MARTLQDQDLKSLQRGEDGKVEVWDIPDGKWKRVAYVDAREMLALGTASLDGPDTPTKPGNPSAEVDSAGSKGSEGKADASVPPDSDEPVDFSRFKVSELQAFCAQAQLDVPDNATKAKLIEILDRASFKPAT